MAKIDYFMDFTYMPGGDPAIRYGLLIRRITDGTGHVIDTKAVATFTSQVAFEEFKRYLGQTLIPEAPASSGEVVLSMTPNGPHLRKGSI